MSRHFGILCCVASTVLLAAGCSKETGAATNSTTSGSQPARGDKESASSAAAASGSSATAPERSIAAAAAPAPAAASPANSDPAPSASVAAPPASTPAPTNGAAAAGEAVVAAAASGPTTDRASVEAARKREQVEWALRQNEIRNDPNGQWAVQSKASSSYNDAQGTAAFSAQQASGAPNVESFGSNSSAWTPKTADSGIEWLELQYAKPVHATMVRVRESNGPGAIIKVELFDEQGAAHTVWSGSDATKGLDFLVAEFQRTMFKTARVKLTLATNTVPGWNAIDAVQLVGTEQ